jgi:ribosomal protein L11 methyltransferase
VVRDRRWVEVWQRTLKPMRIGRRLLIVPRGCRPSRTGGRLQIGVRFGQAFGTGEHASTRMTLRLLEAHLVPGDRVLDLGTGTGILAMAAARLGAGPVLAVDSDSVALRVARANLDDNRLRSAVTLWCGDAGRACDRSPFDLALVNIGASCIARILPGLAVGLAPGGRAILAGILVEDEAALIGQASRLGLGVAGQLRTRPWSALLLLRPAQRSRRPPRAP